MEQLVPVWSAQPASLVGLLLVQSLIAQPVGFGLLLLILLAKAPRIAMEKTARNRIFVFFIIFFVFVNKSALYYTGSGFSCFIAKRTLIDYSK